MRTVILGLLGAIAGALLADGLQESLPVLPAHRRVGFRLDELDVGGLLRLDFGVGVRISLGAILGAVGALVVARRLEGVLPFGRAHERAA